MEKELKSSTRQKKEKNKRKIITIVLGVISLFLIIGVSYAVWRYTFTGQANTLNTERIELELLESTSEVISITNTLPISDKEGIEQSETFDFAVTTRTEAVTDIFYDLKIEKMSVDSGYTSLKDSDIKIYLTDYNNKALIGPIKISDLTDYTFYRTYNKHTKETNEVTTKFKLKAWIDQDVLVNDWNENTRLQYKFKIGTEANEYDRDAVSLNPKGKVPEGAYYANLATGTFYDEMPETVSAGDAYLYGDYLYQYNYDGTGGWYVDLALEEFFAQVGMSEMFAAYPKPTQKQTSYDPILESINGVAITSIATTFENCTSLVEAPVIPDGVTNMDSTFYGCASLTTAPVIPEGVTNMISTFYGCSSLVEAPAIPMGVTNMDYTFYGCTSLVEAPVIPESVTSMNSTFNGCTSLVEAPVIPESVTSMNSTFNGCTSLKAAPVIPSSVTSMHSIFYNCPLLKSDTNVYSFSTDTVHHGNLLDSISGYTTDYKSLNKTLFLKHNMVSTRVVVSQEVCYILNGTMYCLTGGDGGASYETNKATLFESFGEENCSVYSSDVLCSVSGLRANAGDDGYVLANDDDWNCRVSNGGSAYCLEK